MSDNKKYIGIIGAMDQEIKDLLTDLTDYKVETICNIKYYTSTLANKNIVIAKSGIGKVHAALCATTMILSFNIDKIIHIGIAGSLLKELGVNDLAIASSTVQYDIDTTLFNEPLGFISDINLVNLPCEKTLVKDLEKSAEELGINYKTGVIATGDQFVNDENLKKKIIANFNAIACDMESAATGQVCYINKIDFCAIRSFSDGGENVVTDEYFKAKISASDTACAVLKQYIKKHYSATLN